MSDSAKQRGRFANQRGRPKKCQGAETQGRDDHVCRRFRSIWGETEIPRKAEIRHWQRKALDALEFTGEKIELNIPAEILEIECRRCSHWLTDIHLMTLNRIKRQQ